MSSFAASLRGEITRLARKECKLLVEPLLKANSAQRRQIVQLKREIAELRRSSQQALARPQTSSSAAPTSSTKVRFSAAGLKSMRAKLGLSASDFGRLLDASGQSVYNWEAGKSVPRQAQRVKLASLRGLGKREARRRLDAMS